MRRNRSILTVILLLAAVTSSCASQEQSQPNTTEQKVSEAPITEAAETEPKLPEPSIPDAAYDGTTIHIVYETPDMYAVGDEVYAEKEIGDPLNDAVFRRNSMVKERFGVEIKTISTSQFASDLRKSVQADDNAYDLAAGKANLNMSLVNDQLLLPVSELPYFDIEQPWWNRDLISSTEILGKTYSLFGDIGFGWKDTTWALVFNKRLYGEYDLEEPYSLVRNGKWTLDVLETHCKNITLDLNGDSVLDHHDQWGLLSSSNAGLAFVSGFNIRTITQTQDGLSYQLESQQNINAVSRIRSLMTDHGMQLRAEDIKSADIWTDIINVFREGRALYRVSLIRDVISLRDMEDDFGILPLPKLDETQEQYTNTFHVMSAGTAFFVPASVDDPGMISAILEYMSYASVDTVTDAYYNTLLQGKVSRDNESSEMLDIIFEHQFLDIGLLNNLAGIGESLKKMINSDTDITASTAEGIRKTTEKGIEKLVEAYR